MLFPSTRVHIEMNGAKVIDVIGEAAHDLTSEEPFKGNLDIDKLAALIHEQGADKVSCIYVELSVNACGGHPVSLANLERDQCARHGATRFRFFSTLAAFWKIVS